MPDRLGDLSVITNSSDLANADKVLIIPSPYDEKEKITSLSTLNAFLGSARYTNAQIDTLLKDNYSRISSFTADGTFSVPSDTKGRIGYWMIGAGGGGGGSYRATASNSPTNAFAGGGASGTIVTGFINVTASESLTIDVGTGGAGGSGSGFGQDGGEQAQHGSNGTNSRILRSSTVLALAAAGGGGGRARNEANVGGGGILTSNTGTVLLPGAVGYYSTETISGRGGGYGGGDAVLNAGVGNNAVANSGGGGSGSVSRDNSTGFTGGSGAAGKVIIFY